MYAELSRLWGISYIGKCIGKRFIISVLKQVGSIVDELKHFFDSLTAFFNHCLVEPCPILWNRECGERVYTVKISIVLTQTTLQFFTLTKSCEKFGHWFFQIDCYGCYSDSDSINSIASSWVEVRIEYRDVANLRQGKWVGSHHRVIFRMIAYRGQAINIFSCANGKNTGK